MSPLEFTGKCSPVTYTSGIQLRPELNKKKKINKTFIFTFIESLFFIFSRIILQIYTHAFYNRGEKMQGKNDSNSNFGVLRTGKHKEAVSKLTGEHKVHPYLRPETLCRGSV
jgi:hypothetical protein